MTTHRRLRFAPAALLLACTLATANASADEPLAPRVAAEDGTQPDFEPFEAPTRMASPTLAVVGASMMGVGTAGLLTGGVMIATADENPGAPDFVTGPVLLLGGVLFAAGIPIFAVGAREVPVGESGGAVPVVRVGAGVADATWHF